MAIATIVLLVSLLVSIWIAVLACAGNSGGAKKKKKKSSRRQSVNGPPSPAKAEPSGHANGQSGSGRNSKLTETGQQVPKPLLPGLVASKLKQWPGNGTRESVDAPSGLKTKSAILNGPNANLKLDPNESVPQKLKHALPKQMFRPVGGRGALCLDEKIPMVHSLSDDEDDRAVPGDDAKPDQERPMGSKINQAQDQQDLELGLKVTHLKADSTNQKYHGKTG